MASKTTGGRALNGFLAKLFASRETISESIRRRYAVDAGKKVLEELYINSI
jgi:hypothetical protein